MFALVAMIEWQEVIVVLASLIITGLHIWSLIDIIKSKFDGYGKIKWLVIVLFVFIFGPVLYFVIGSQQKVKTN